MSVSVYLTKHFMVEITTFKARRKFHRGIKLFAFRHNGRSTL